MAEDNGRRRAAARLRHELLFNMRSTLRGCDTHRLLQAEFQQGFAGDLDLSTLGQNLYGTTGGPASRRANSRALAAARDGSDYGSNSGAPANLFGRRGTLPLALQGVITADDRIVAPVNDQARQFQLQLRFTGEVSTLRRFGQPAIDVGSLAGNDGVADGQVRLKAGMEDVADMVFRGVYTIN